MTCQEGSKGQQRSVQRAAGSIHLLICLLKLGAELVGLCLLRRRSRHKGAGHGPRHPTRGNLSARSDHLVKQHNMAQPTCQRLCRSWGWGNNHHRRHNRASLQLNLDRHAGPAFLGPRTSTQRPPTILTDMTLRMLASSPVIISTDFQLLTGRGLMTGP